MYKWTFASQAGTADFHPSAAAGVCIGTHDKELIRADKAYMLAHKQ